LLDFKHSFLGNLMPKEVARQKAERNIDQIRRDVYNSHHHRAYALAYYMTGNELEAEDLLARCFTRAFANKEVPEGGDVDRSLLEELRMDGVLEELETGTLPASGAGLQAEASILRTDMEEALRELPSVERMIFLLSDVEGYRTAAIAGLLGRPEAEIARSLMAARLRLRQIVAGLQQKRGHAA
jgi:RNA polymerase sigma-70 factor, ECF subfamily